MEERWKGRKMLVSFCFIADNLLKSKTSEILKCRTVRSPETILYPTIHDES